MDPVKEELLDRIVPRAAFLNVPKVSRLSIRRKVHLLKKVTQTIKELIQIMGGKV
jgi:hypothetical protein